MRTARQLNCPINIYQYRNNIRAKNKHFSHEADTAQDVLWSYVEHSELFTYTSVTAHLVVNGSSRLRKKEINFLRLSLVKYIHHEIKVVRAEGPEKAIKNFS